MKNPSFALAAMLSALLLGVLGDWLLRSHVWGFGLSVWFILAIIEFIVVARFTKEPMSKEVLFPVACILLFSLMFSWRDAIELKAANTATLFLCVGLLAVKCKQGALALGSIFDYTARMFERWTWLILDGVLLPAEEVEWKVDKARGARLSRALGISIFLIIVFGALFVSADAMFERAVNNIFSFNFEELTLHFVGIFIVTVLVAGLFRRLFFPERIHSEPLTANEPLFKQPPRLGLTDVGMILGTLCALFGVFVAIQFKYLFLGSPTGVGITYSEYARRGFFELVLISALTLGVIVLFHTLLEQERRTRRLFSLLSALLVALVFIVMASAVKRMLMYVDAYGLTGLRIYPTAFMLWLALVFVWLALTVLREKRQYFAFGALVAGFVVILGLNVANPDALIARVNTSRPKVDADFLNTLSADAVPTLVANLSILTTETRTKILGQLKTKWAAPNDWRAYSFSTVRARQMLFNLQP